MAAHFLSCKKVQGYTKIHRHDELARAFARVLGRHDISSCKVSAGYALQDGRRPDLLVFLPSAIYCLDFAVVTSMAPSYVSHCVRRPEYALQVREHAKNKFHGPSAVANGHWFVPMVWDAMGSHGQAVAFFLGVLEYAVANGKQVVADLHRACSAAIQIGNARLLRHAGSVVAAPPLAAVAPTEMDVDEFSDQDLPLTQDLPHVARCVIRSRVSFRLPPEALALNLPVTVGVAAPHPPLIPPHTRSNEVLADPSTGR